MWVDNVSPKGRSCWKVADGAPIQGRLFGEFDGATLFNWHRSFKDGFPSPAVFRKDLTGILAHSSHGFPELGDKYVDLFDAVGSVPHERDSKEYAFRGRVGFLAFSEGLNQCIPCVLRLVEPFGDMSRFDVEAPIRRRGTRPVRGFATSGRRPG